MVGLAVIRLVLMPTVMTLLNVIVYLAGVVVMVGVKVVVLVLPN